MPSSLSLRHQVWLIMCSMLRTFDWVSLSVWKSLLAWFVHSVWHWGRRKFLTSCTRWSLFGPNELIPDGLSTYLGWPKGLEFGKDTWREAPHKWYVECSSNSLGRFLGVISWILTKNLLTQGGNVILDANNSWATCLITKVNITPKFFSFLKLISC